MGATSRKTVAEVIQGAIQYLQEMKYAKAGMKLYRMRFATLARYPVLFTNFK